jgi:hypothetical protein
MGRWLCGFVVGTLGGLIVGYLAWILYLDGWWAAHGKVLSREAFVAWEYKREPQLWSIYLLGSLCCGVFGAYALNLPLGKTVAHRRRQLLWKARTSADAVLSTEEFQRVFQACQWISTAGGPEYLRGFIVGRLAESWPAIAKKVDGFDDAHMTAVCDDLRYNRVAGTRPQPKVDSKELTDDEIEQLCKARLGFDLHDRDSNYFRGLLVGRLAESQPALAYMVNDLSGAALGWFRAHMDDFEARHWMRDRPDRAK